MKKIALIGSTGSIGKQVLNVVRRYPEKYQIISLSAGENAELLLEQVKEFNPKVATVKAETDVSGFNKTEFFFGEDAFKNAILSEADLVVIALVGFKGIIAVLESIKKGKNIALANKESLVVGGSLVMKKAKEKGIKIIPIDSEHSAVFQALNFDVQKPFKKIILTCSGGAFRDFDKEKLKNATASMALMHPNWNMGKKITVDCATLVNKGFEVIEAKWLYNTDFDNINVIIHRESIIHSMVEFNDGSVMAQLSYPNMELPISVALSYPERLDIGLQSLDFVKLKSLSFEEYDKERFPNLDLVIKAGKKGGLYPAVINGANEQAVKLFLENKISFNDIYTGLKGALDCFVDKKAETYEDYFSANAFGENFIKNKFGV